MKNIQVKKFLTYMTMLLILTACSSSNDRLEEPLSGVQDSESDFTLMSFTRANNALTIEEEYASIGMFLVGSDTQHKQFHYRQNDHRWHSNIEVVSGQGYRIYAYAPADAVMAAISEESAAGVTMTFTQLPTVSSQDICFAVGVQHMTEANVAKDIKLGKFSFTGAVQDHNFVNLLMDHLYAGIKLQMTIDNDYAQLRTIKIRKLELKSTNSTAQAVVTLTSNTENTDPVQSVTYSGLSGTERIVTFFESAEGEALNATNITTPLALEAMCCFVPTLSNDLTLVTTYGIYDKHGNMISERTASNKLPTMEVARGECVTLAMSVRPTYLYVLSDPDLDNPTITVN